MIDRGASRPILHGPAGWLCKVLLIAAAGLSACSRPLTESAVERATIAVTSVGPARDNERPQRQVAFHLASTAVDRTLDWRRSTDDLDRHYEIPGLSVGPGFRSYSIEQPDSTKGSPQDYPNTWLLTRPRGGVCVATSIGPRTLLTAAHCLEGLDLELRAGGQAPIQATCTLMKGYRQNVPPYCSKTPEKDLALCNTRADVLPGPHRYESIDAKPPGELGSIQITTFPDSPPYPVAYLLLVELPIAERPPKSVTARATGGPQAWRLRRGDSGGPWMQRRSDGSGSSVTAIHVCIENGDTSIAASLDTDEAHAFLEGQEVVSGSPICGLSAQPDLCR